MADANRSDAVISSVPPQVGAGGQPRFPQQVDRPTTQPLGYGGPPPPGAYGGPYSSYPPPPYGSYGAGPVPGSVPGSIPGGPPPPGYPRPGYAPGPHTAAYGAGYGPGSGSFPNVHHPPYYGGGYDGHFAGQPPPGHLAGQHPSYRGPSPIPPNSTSGPNPNIVRSVPPPSSNLSKNAGSQPGALKAPVINGGKGGTAGQAPETTQQHALPDEGEVERLRAAAATEITNEEVKPIQTDFHFFVKEHIETHRKLAEEEVRNSLEDKSSKLDPMLVNTNLNTRLMKAWEALTKDSREAYMVQEEADRRRFMEDDEIASRHCATLTARGKSPRVIVSDSNRENTPQAKERQSQVDINEPKTSEDKEGTNKNEKTEVPTDKKEEPKRSAPEPTAEGDATDDLQVSPTKKTKSETIQV